MADVLASVTKTEVYKSVDYTNLFLFVDCYNDGSARWYVSSSSQERKRVQGFVWDQSARFKPHKNVYRLLRTETPTTSIDESEIWE